MTTPNDRPDVPPVPSGPADPAATIGGEPATQPAPQAAPTAPAWTAGADLKSTIEDGARAIDERAQALGREAEAAARRWGENPAVKETADLAARLWGLVLLAFGLWFFADVTLDLELPVVRWGELWPVVLIIVGGFVVLRGMTGRR